MAYGGTVGRPHCCQWQRWGGVRLLLSLNAGGLRGFKDTAASVERKVVPGPALQSDGVEQIALVLGERRRPGGRGAPAGQGGDVFVGRRRGAGLTPWHRLISNQFQSGGCEATKVGEIRCREARPIMDCCGRDQAVGQ